MMNALSKVSSRSDIKNLIVSLEKQLRVDSWTAGDVHIWPYIRLKLFFFLRARTSAEKDTMGKRIRTKQFESGNMYLKLLKGAFGYLIFLRRLRRSKYVMVAGRAYRVRHQNVLYNRFFDTFIDKEKTASETLFIEIGGQDLEGIAHPGCVVSYGKIIEGHDAYLKLKRKLGRPKKKAVLHIPGFTEFSEVINSIPEAAGFLNRFGRDRLASTLEEDVFQRMDCFRRIFRRVRPQKLYILCYYTDLGLVAAANSLGIETIDMQHGAQAAEHLGYGSWTNVPASGYSILPSRFWCWDDHSRENIESWTRNTTFHSAFTGGNLWVEYWKRNEKKYAETDFVLYTLQPRTLSHTELFPETLLNYIRSRNKRWFIRLHPIQTEELPQIKSLLKAAGVSHLVNTDDATSDPLPLLLRNCALHITNSSASAIEASMFGKLTVLLHPIGKLYYKNLLDDGSAIFLEPDDNFATALDGIFERLKAA